MAEILTRLRLALRVLAGRAVMYRVKVPGTIMLAADYGTVVVECEFRPSAASGTDK